jgi:hypothetical protein
MNLQPTTYDMTSATYQISWQPPVKTSPSTHDAVQSALTVEWREPAQDEEQPCASTRR